MRILFQLVHPSKYQLHKVTINRLISENHDVDVLIQKKDILETLVRDEKWNYFNLFPKGRKNPSLPKLLSNVLMLFLTVLRQLKFVKNRHYDLFVGGELGISAKFRSIPSIYVTDADIYNAPHQMAACILADYIFCPEVCDMGVYNKKKIAYDGFKALCHLHPNYFEPDENKIPQFLRDKRFFVIRTSSHNSHHDAIETKGISNKTLFHLTKFLEKYGEIVLSSERTLPRYFSKYNTVDKKGDMAHYIYFADIFVGDSVTMSVEACVLGTLSVEYDTWWRKFKQMEALADDYNLLIGIEPDNIEKLIVVLKQVIDNFDKIRNRCLLGRKKLLSEKMDVSNFQYWLIHNFPYSISQLNENSAIKQKFYI